MAKLLHFRSTAKLVVAFTLLCVFTACHPVRYSSRAPSGVDRLRQYDSKQGSLYWSHFDATTRASIIHVDSAGKVRVLSEVPPDVALNKLASVAAEAKVPKGDSAGITANLKLETAKTVAELGKRTAAVNILRDALYRLAEINNNSDTAHPLSQDMKALIERVIDTAKEISIAENTMDAERAKADASQAAAKQLTELNRLVEQMNLAKQTVTTEDLFRLVGTP